MASVVREVGAAAGGDRQDHDGQDPWGGCEDVVVVAASFRFQV